MHFVAFIEFEEAYKDRLPNKSVTCICKMDGITDESLGKKWLEQVYGGIAKEITMCDETGKEIVCNVK